MSPDLPVVLATGYAEIPGEGGDDIARIGKPYTRSQLGSEIAKLIETQPA